MATINPRMSPDLGLGARGRTLMDADRARALAERLHHGQRDAGGARLIDHVRRVAATVAPDARVVAWLHEVLEHTSISEETLLMQGLSTAELRAIRLVTHDNIARSDASYVAHIALLAQASGAGARLARSVKCTDLADRLRNPAIRPDGWSPPYERGLQILQRADSRRRRRRSVVREAGSP
jgi:hypothetical protein